MEDADVIQKGNNPSCGDDLVFYLKWQGDALTDISFEGFGCAISQSGASMLTDKIKGMTKQEIQALSITDMYEMYGAPIGTQREKCAMLSLNTLHQAIR